MTKKLLATMLLVAMLISCFSGVTMVSAGEVVDLTADEEVTTPETGEEVPEEDPEPTQLSGELTELPAGEYVLVDDVTMLNTINLEGAVEIDLAGYTLTAPENAQAFTGAHYSSLTVTDSSEEGTGTIKGNGTVNAHGGFIAVPYRGGFYMTGGTITGFHTTQQGGVFYFGGERTIVLNDVTVTDNTAEKSGGVMGGGGGRLTTVTINGGTFTGNTVTGGNGAVVYANWADVTVHDATITGNMAKDVTFHVSGKFTMDSGVISGNTELDGETPIRALHLNAYDGTQSADPNDNATVGDFSGTAVIGDKGITVGGNRSNGNAYDAPASEATVHDLEEGASVLGSNVLTVGDNTVAETIVEGGILYTVSDGSLHSGWNKISGEIAELPAGNYILEGDAQLTGTITLAGHTKLCLNGKTLTAPEAVRAFVIPVNTSLTVCDCSEEGTGTIQGNGTVAEVGVFAWVQGTFTLESGTIEGFSTTGMGAVLMATDDSVVNINGGTIKGNTANIYGAVIYLNKNATVNFNGGEITENEAPSAAVLFSESYTNTVNFAGTNFTDNVATAQKSPQGSVMWGNKVGTVNISGGEFTGNSRAIPIVVNGATVTITGGKFYGNYNAAGALDDLHLNNYKKGTTATISGNPEFVGGINISDARGTEGEANYIPSPSVTVSNLTSGAYFATNMPLTIAEGDATVKETQIDRYFYTYAEDVYAHLGWTKIAGEVATLAAGNYELSGDLALTGTVTVAGDINICLNGYTLTAPEAAQAFVINSGSVTVCDCSAEGTGTIQGNGTVAVDGAFAKLAGGSFTLKSGTITGFTSSARGGVFVVNGADAVLTVEGGKITGNAGNTAGGVFAAYNGTVNLFGGEISDNTSSNAVGAVAITYGDRTKPVISLTGTVVKNNTGKGGVFQLNGGLFTISGGKITENKSGGATLSLQATDLTISGGEITGNLNYAGNAAQQEAITLALHYSSAVHSSAVLTGNAVVEGDIVVKEQEGITTKKDVLGEDGKPTYDDEGEKIREEVFVPADAANSAIVENLTETALIKSGTQIPTGEGAVEQTFEGYYVYTMLGNYVEGEDPEEPEVHECSPAEAVEENRKEATCSAEGSYDLVVYCSDPTCGKELSRKNVVIEKLAHTEGTAVEENRKEATCSAEGSYESVVKCSECGEELSRKTVVIAKAAHTPVEVVDPKYVATAATTKAAATLYKVCEVCGETLEETYTYGAKLLDSATFMTTMSLENELNMMFGVKKSLRSDWTGIYAKIVKDVAGGEPVEKVIPSEEWGFISPYHAIEFSGIAGKEMTDGFALQLFDANDMPISTVREDSVKAYVLRAYGNTTVAVRRTLFIDMLNYGAAAQEYFTYNVENLANAGLTEEQLSYATTGDVALTNCQKTEGNVVGMTLDLGSRILIRVGVKGVDASCYATYSYTSHTGKEVTGRIEGSDFGKLGNVTAIDMNTQVLADARQPFTLEVFNAEGDRVAYVYDSLEAYIQRALIKYDNDLFVAIMKFADAAYAMLHA